MRFSIIVPVYNASKTLSFTVDSILNQSYKDYELILVNDGSKDASLDICRHYEMIDQRVVVVDKENGGVSTARNKGLEVARGEYVCFVDADDLVKPDWLKTYAVNNAEDLLCQGMELKSETKSVCNSFEEELSFSGKDLLEAARLINEKHALNPPWSKCYKRAIIQKHDLLFWTGCHLYEDLIFTLQFLQYASSVRVLPYEGYIYRLYDSVLTKRFNPPEAYLSWIKRVVKELTLFVKGDYDSAVYCDVVRSQFSLAAWFVIQYYSHIDRKIRMDFYRFLSQLVPSVDFSKLEKNRYVFKFCKYRMMVDLGVGVEAFLLKQKRRHV